MVIGVEGNVHVGKTTYINNNFKDYCIKKETEFNSSLDAYDRQLYYIKKEYDRNNDKSNKVILDRTIISIIIYTMYSNELSINQKKELLNMIKNMLNKNSFIIPNYIHYISYPYKLICSNHQKLASIKGTQTSLVDYNYYLLYSMFFANREESFKKIIGYQDYRQVLLYDKSIFNNLFTDNNIKSNILLDGEKMFLSNIDKELVNNINYNSFFNDIINQIYNGNLDKNKKIELLKKIVSSINLNQYYSKIIYLSTGNLKNNALSFYQTLDNSLGNLSNITIIDTSILHDNLNDILSNVKEKPLMLNDLFYEIEENIKRGKI